MSRVFSGGVGRFPLAIAGHLRQSPSIIITGRISGVCMFRRLYNWVLEKSRGPRAPHALAAVSFPTYQPESCPLCAEGKPVVKPGSRT